MCNYTNALYRGKPEIGFSDFCNPKLQFDIKHISRPCRPRISRPPPSPCWPAPTPPAANTIYRNISKNHCTEMRYVVK